MISLTIHAESSHDLRLQLQTLLGTVSPVSVADTPPSGPQTVVVTEPAVPGAAEPARRGRRSKGAADAAGAADATSSAPNAATSAPPPTAAPSAGTGQPANQEGADPLDPPSFLKRDGAGVAGAAAVQVPPVSQPTAAVAQPTIEDVRKALSTVVEKHGMDAGRAFVQEVAGVPRVGEVPREKYAEFIAKAAERAAQAKAA